MLLALGPEPVALAAEDLDFLRLLSCLLELLLEAGQFIAMRLFGVIEGPAEGVAIRAELITFGPEATGLVSPRLLMLGECRSQLLSLVHQLLSVDAQATAGRRGPSRALHRAL